MLQSPPMAPCQIKLLTLPMLNDSAKATEPPAFSSTALLSIQRALKADSTGNQETFKVQDDLL